MFISPNTRMKPSPTGSSVTLTPASTTSRKPLIGAPLALSHLVLKGIRKWRVNGFDSHLIFYLPRTDGVSIVRVLHAAQDWWSLLGLTN